MKKLIAALALLVSVSVSAQTLFYYGNDSVSVKEFLNAYHKNNAGAHSEKAFLDYLNLYIASRLKIKEAKEKGYDTLPQLVADLENLRQQILPSYLNDKESMEKLTNEAFQRAQKDIHLAHIFISFQQRGMIDTATAEKKLNEVVKQLKSGADFKETARKYSDDPAVKKNSGDLGYITAFILPYDLENLAYKTPVGQVSTVFRSKAGYHIFKNLGERKDPGRIKAAEILLALPPEADDQTKQHLKKLADSLYQRLQKGDDFGKLASQFSNDVLSSSANGQMQEFGVGQYDPVFEQQVFALPKDGAISQPFLTSHGYHIVKRISRLPVNTNKSNTESMQALKLRIERSDRIKTVKAALAHKIVKEAGYTKVSFKNETLWAYSDSVINFAKPAFPINLNSKSVLLTIGNKSITVNDWINYIQTFRYKPDGSGIKPYTQLWDEFVEAMAIDYYTSHLEDFNDEFKKQLNEFKEGSLFFEIMQRQVWNPVQSDTAALMKYYEAHTSDYYWKKSADAVIFYANDPGTARTFISEMKKDPSSWHRLVSNFSEKIAADSSRFELTQIPNPTGQTLKPEVITAPLINKSDNTTSFAYILHLHNKPEPRSFSEARGLVINDYQNVVEKEWVESLKKKYPLQVNEKVLNELLKAKKY